MIAPIQFTKTIINIQTILSESFLNFLVAASIIINIQKTNKNIIPATSTIMSKIMKTINPAVIIDISAIGLLSYNEFINIFNESTLKQLLFS
jgi:hypothetical protein